MEAKVTIEITSVGYTKTVQIGDKTFKEEWLGTGYGAECDNGCFEFEDGISDELYDALEGMDGAYEVMKALYDIEEGESA